jgi:hypothetical protein
MEEMFIKEAKVYSANEGNAEIFGHFFFSVGRRLKLTATVSWLRLPNPLPRRMD